MKKIALIISILIAQMAGIIGSVFTASSVGTWYADLVKPAFNPPSWVFGPVWITLYTLMGIAAYLVWVKKNKNYTDNKDNEDNEEDIKKGTSGSNKNVKTALIVYGVHLVLNSLWSILFFGLRNPGAAFLEIILLLGFIIATMILFWRINTLAGVLLLPYLAWVFFAAFLNYTLWQLN